MDVLAYHIIWTTYGTLLHGDSRGWVSKTLSGVQEPDPLLEQQARERMAGDPVFLTTEQREIVDRTIRRHCEIRRWTLHALNVRTNHVHVVVTADRSPDDVMEQLKAWGSRMLSDAAGLQSVVAKKAGRKRWFTEGGSKDPIDTEEYLQEAINYVIDGQ